MLPYCLKRLLSAIPTLLVLMTLTFSIMRTVPGGPFDSERALPDEVKANIAAKYHFDEPLWKQYGRYLRDLTRGDLGPSYRYMGARGVNEIIAESMPVSLQLGFWAIALSIICGVPLGAIAAYKRNSLFDFSATFFAVSGISLPNYLLASILILIFSMHLGWFPPALWEDWRSMVLPVLTLAARPMALIARLTRASLLETLHNDYIRTARSKGLSGFSVLFKHALKNALIPVITMLGPLTAAVITGSFVIEVMFAIPGMGKHFVSAVTDRDYPLIMGVTVVYGIIVITANLIVDLLYAWVDPRIRIQ